MGFVTSGWCTQKWLRLDQTIRNITCGDLEMLLVLMQQGATGLKKSWFV